MRAVRALGSRATRERAGRFVVEGPQGVREALAAHAAARDRPPVVHDLYVSAAAQTRHADLIEAAETAGVRVLVAADDVLADMAGTVAPQGLLAVCAAVGVPLEQAMAARPRLVAVLAQVRDPGNCGTLLRVADAAGAEAAILTHGCVDVHNPKCVRASAGSIFHLPIVTGVPLDQTARRLGEAGLVVYAADGAGDLDLDDLADVAAAGAPGGLAGPVAWVFGNEAWGLPTADVAVADASVRVPLHGRAESLNVAAAAAVCLYATARAQRRGAGCRTGAAAPARASTPI